MAVRARLLPLTPSDWHWSLVLVHFPRPCKAIGRALKDERRLRGELAQLEEEVAGPLADRLRILTEIVAEERKGSAAPD